MNASQHLPKASPGMTKPDDKPDTADDAAREAQPSAALADLLARVEGATGADRELDAQLWLRFTPGATRKDSVVKSSKGLWPDYTIDETRDRGVLVVVPALTASLDAALALCERALPGCEYQLRGGPETGDTEAWATAELTTMNWPTKGWYTAASFTPALALLAAMLKAKIAKGDQ